MMIPKSLRRWVEIHLRDYVFDIAEHGANCGFPGITYYSDTSLLYKWYAGEIWDMLYHDAQEYGVDNIIEYISQWRGVAQITDETTFQNMLVWYAVEEICFDICNDHG